MFATDPARTVSEEYGDSPQADELPTPDIRAAVITRRWTSTATAAGDRPSAWLQTDLDYLSSHFIPSRPSVTKTLERQDPSQYGF
jgi:short subunit dehydrogenase-like uncharacterized protein